VSSSLIRAYRGIRFGKAIVVVSGLPRSGTSMAMRMLDAGGFPIVSDGVRRADEHNPGGYYEHERVKELEKDPDKSWLRNARGKAIKIISFLLPQLPDVNNYRVIFMHRNLEEIIASQNALLRARGEHVDSMEDGPVRVQYEDHLYRVAQLLRTRRCFEVLDVRFCDVLRLPTKEAGRIRRFLGAPLEESSMAAAVEPALHRMRR